MVQMDGDIPDFVIFLYGCQFYFAHVASTLPMAELNSANFPGLSIILHLRVNISSVEYLCCQLVPSRLTIFQTFVFNNV
jgi:hypothetical protein